MRRRDRRGARRGVLGVPARRLRLAHRSGGGARLRGRARGAEPPCPHRHQRAPGAARVPAGRAGRARERIRVRPGRGHGALPRCLGHRIERHLRGGAALRLAARGEVLRPRALRALRVDPRYAPARVRDARGVPHPGHAEGFPHLFRGAHEDALRGGARDHHARPPALDRDLDGRGSSSSGASCTASSSAAPRNDRIQTGWFLSSGVASNDKNQPVWILSV